MDSVGKKISALKIITYLAVLTIFGDALSFIYLPTFEIRVTFLTLLFILAIILPFLNTISFNRYFFLAIGTIFTVSLINVLAGNNGILPLLKQVFAISLSSLVFYMLIKANNYDLKGIFSIYLNLAFLIAIIGLIQEFAYIHKIPYMYGFGYFLPKWIFSARDDSMFIRVNSILTEPASFCFALTPAFFCALTSFFKKDFRLLSPVRSCAIIISYLLTFSSLAVIGIVISIMLISYYFTKRRYSLLILVLPVILLILSYQFVYEFRVRFKDYLSVVRGKTVIENTNQSTFSLLANSRVTSCAFKHSPIFGYGLGSYETSFNRYIGKAVNPSYQGGFPNAKDANSLFLRLTAETGLLGLGLFFYFLVTSYLSGKRDPMGYFWIINNGILVLFILRLIRQGHYFSEGFFFFFWVYYFSKKLVVDPELMKKDGSY